MSRLLLTGVLAALGAALATTAVAALGRAGGVDLEVSGEAIPLSGIAVVTGVLSLVGLVLAAALRRWSARPAARFVAATVALTAVSLVPPLLADADAATVGTLVGLHVVAAVVVIPVLARGLGSASGSASASASASAKN